MFDTTQLSVRVVYALDGSATHSFIPEIAWIDTCASQRDPGTRNFGVVTNKLWIPAQSSDYGDVKAEAVTTGEFGYICHAYCMGYDVPFCRRISQWRSVCMIHRTPRTVAELQM